jgi:hypothetical protein
VLVGEFFGLDQDAQLFWYSRQHHADASPGPIVPFPSCWCKEPRKRMMFLP